MCFKGEQWKDICPCQHSSPVLPKQSLILFLTWSVCVLTTSLKTVRLWLPIYFWGSCFAFDFWNLAQPSPRWTRGALGAFCLCKRVNGWCPLDLMEMNGELWEQSCKCTSTTLVSGGPFPVARWIITMFLPRVRVLMWGAFGPPQVLFMAMIYSLKEQTETDKPFHHKLKHIF